MAHLWTREKAREMREPLRKELNKLKVGDVMVIDLDRIEVFDYSFANEFFGKTLLSLPSEHEGIFVVIESPSDYARENLAKALESLGLAMIERNGKKATLIGKTHPKDEETFAAILRAKGSVTAAALGKQLDVNLTAVNERLSKLVSLGLARREKGVSAAGREQFEYRTLR